METTGFSGLLTLKDGEKEAQLQLSFAMTADLMWRHFDFVMQPKYLT